jgi:hypothetical protein
MIQFAKFCNSFIIYNLIRFQQLHSVTEQIPALVLTEAALCMNVPNTVCPFYCFYYNKTDRWTRLLWIGPFYFFPTIENLHTCKETQLTSRQEFFFLIGTILLCPQYIHTKIFNESSLFMYNGLNAAMVSFSKSYRPVKSYLQMYFDSTLTKLIELKQFYKSAIVTRVLGLNLAQK